MAALYGGLGGVFLGMAGGFGAIEHFIIKNEKRKINNHFETAVTQYEKKQAKKQQATSSTTLGVQTVLESQQVKTIDHSLPLTQQIDQNPHPQQNSQIMSVPQPNPTPLVQDQIVLPKDEEKSKESKIYFRGPR